MQHEPSSTRVQGVEEEKKCPEINEAIFEAKAAHIPARLQILVKIEFWSQKELEEITIAYCVLLIMILPFFLIGLVLIDFNI